VGVIDAQTGLHNEPYLRRRLREETSRAQRTGSAFDVVTMTVRRRYGDDDSLETSPIVSDLRKVARALESVVPDDAVLAHLRGGLFAAIVPDGLGSGPGLLETWRSVVRIRLNTTSHPATSWRISTGSCTYAGDAFTGDASALEVVEQLSAPRASERQDVTVADGDLAATADAANGKGTAETAAEPPSVEATGDGVTARTGDARRGAARPARASSRAGATSSSAVKGEKAAARPSASVGDARGDANRRRTWKASGRASGRAD
jgi:GGDEF domain-containing protein